MACEKYWYLQEMMNKRWLIVSILFCWKALAWAVSPVDQLTQLLNQDRTYTATFHQITIDNNQHIIQQSSGQVMIQRPGKCRWITEKPTEDWLIINGNTFWHYDPSLMEADKKQLSAMVATDNPVTVLTAHLTDLSDYYVVSRVILQGKQWYQLLPKKADATVKKMYFYFNQGTLTQLIVVDQLAHRSLFQFSNIHLNTEIPSSAFIFKPAKGVDVD